MCGRAPTSSSIRRGSEGRRRAPVVTRPGSHRSRGRVGVARLLFLLGGLAGCASSIPEASEPTPAELTLAIYTEEQATRGQRIFTTVCAVCHGRNEFVGPIFTLTWQAEPVGSLFEHISTTMPQDRPGSLSAAEYASVVAYLLQLNGRTSGEEELPADAELLSRMRW